MYSRCAYFRVPASAVFSEDFGRFEQEVEVLLFCCVRSRVSKLFTFSSFAGCDSCSSCSCPDELLRGQISTSHHAIAPTTPHISIRSSPGPKEHAYLSIEVMELFQELLCLWPVMK
jgi:hypothetical protein